MTEFNIEEFAELGPAEFTRLVKRTPHAMLDKAMRSEYREKIVTTIFETIPTMFRPERAGGITAIIHWYVTGRPDGGTDAYQIAIVNRTCTVTPLPDPANPETAPRLKISMDGVSFLQLVAGTTNPAMMFMMGKIKAKGDIALATSIGNIFNWPRA
ncbi:MAG: SCP2 sterol-binding domain-containing protein [Micromonosporaceae bacterium]|nr:SCP2 sterol-binding domain-containing protein [Micromonosporaceae bacterium]